MIIYCTLWRYFVCADQVRIEDPPQEDRRAAWSASRHIILPSSSLPGQEVDEIAHKVDGY